MAYVPKDWSLSDSITEADLDHIETGVSDAHSDIAAIKTGAGLNDDSISTRHLAESADGSAGIIHDQHIKVGTIGGDKLQSSTIQLEKIGFSTIGGVKLAVAQGNTAVNTWTRLGVGQFEGSLSHPAVSTNAKVDVVLTIDGSTLNNGSSPYTLVDAKITSYNTINGYQDWALSGQTLIDGNWGQVHCTGVVNLPTDSDTVFFVEFRSSSEVCTVSELSYMTWVLGR